LIKRLALVTVLAITLGTPAFAQDEDAENGVAEAGVVEGTVANGTADGTPIGMLELTLRSYPPEGDVTSMTTIAGEDGAFRFTGVSTDHQLVHQVEAEFQGTTYFSQPITFVEGQELEPIDMMVYDTTSDSSAISLGLAHTIITEDESGLEVQEVSVFVNSGDRTYVGPEDESVGGERPTVRFSLPSGATDVRIDPGVPGMPFSTEYGFIHTMPVRPGETTFSYSYRINTEVAGYTFNRYSFYPTTQYSMMIQTDTLDAEAEGLTVGPPSDMNGLRFLVLSGQGLAADQAVSATLIAPASGLSPAIWVVLALVLVGGVAGLTYSRRRQRAGAEAPETVAEEPAAAGDDVEAMLAEIARLDDEFENGGLDEKTYRQQRDATKARLADIMRSSAGADGET
jgi:hypothetical protein